MSRGRKTTTRRALLVLATTLVSGGLVYLIWLVSHRNRITVAGFTVSVGRVTVGQKHEWIYGGLLSPLRRQLARHPFLAQLGIKAPQVLTLNRTTDSVTIWFEFESAAKQSLPTHQVWLVNETSRLAVRAAAINPFYVRQGKIVLAAAFDNFPHHDPACKAAVVIYAPDSGAATTHYFRLPELRWPKSKANARPPPAQMTNLVELDLNTFETGRHAKGTPNEWLSESVAHFSCSTQAGTAASWVPTHITAESATGLQFQRSGEARPGIKNEISFSFPEILWPSEAPWKIQVKFTRQGNFAEQDVWHHHLPNLQQALQHSRTTEVPLATNQINGWPVTLASLRPSTEPGRGLELWIKFQAPESVSLALAAAQDDAGNSVPVRTVAESRGAKEGLQVYSLGVPIQTVGLGLKIGLQTNQTLEFIVTPQLNNKTARSFRNGGRE